MCKRLVIAGIAALTLATFAIPALADGPVTDTEPISGTLPGIDIGGIASDLAGKAVDIAQSDEARQAAQTAGQLAGNGASLIGQGVGAAKQEFQNQNGDGGDNDRGSDNRPGLGLDLGFTLGFANKTSLVEAQAYQQRLEADANFLREKARAEADAEVARLYAKYADELAKLEVDKAEAELAADIAGIEHQLAVDVAALEEEKKAKVAAVLAEIAHSERLEAEEDAAASIAGPMAQNEARQAKAKTTGLIWAGGILLAVTGSLGIAFAIYANLRATGTALLQNLGGYVLPQPIRSGKTTLWLSLQDGVHGKPPYMTVDEVPGFLVRLPEKAGEAVQPSDEVLIAATQVAGALTAHAESQAAEERRQAQANRGGPLARIIAAVKSSAPRSTTIVRRGGHVHVDSSSDGRDEDN